jgi:hypothetical protein
MITRSYDKEQQKVSGKTYRTKQQVAARYGVAHPISIDRAVRDGRLPPPEYPLGPKRPRWSEETLDAHDRRAVTAAITKQAS